MCENGQWPELTITPIAGNVAYDWVEYDVFCDNTIELTGPAGTIFTDQGTNNNYLICVTFYKVINGDTCDFEVIRDLSLEPCEDCDNLDWSMTSITLDTMCVGNTWPEITITPIAGSVAYDWIEYDVSCDNTIELTGPAGTTFIDQGAGFNYLICATFYKIVNGDTCDYQVIRDLSLDSCYTEMPLCCIDQVTTDARAALTTVTVASNGSTVLIDHPNLYDCEELIVTWGDSNSAILTASDLPFTITFPVDGSYPVSISLIDSDASGMKCFESIVYQNFINSVEDLLADEISISPNPFLESFSMDFGELETNNLTYKIYDIHGRCLETNGVEASNMQISMENKSQGLYYVQVLSENQLIYTSKLVKM